MGYQTKKVEDLDDSSLRQIKSKYTKAKINLKETCASSVAPGQCDILKEYLSQSDEENKVISKEHSVHRGINPSPPHQKHHSTFLAKPPP